MDRVTFGFEYLVISVVFIIIFVKPIIMKVERSIKETRLNGSLLVSSIFILISFMVGKPHDLKPEFEFNIIPFYVFMSFSIFSLIVGAIFYFKSKKETQNYLPDKPTKDIILDNFGEIIHENIQSIELIPQPTNQKTHQNLVIITVNGNTIFNEKTVVANRDFHLLYYLCLERLAGIDERWLPLHEKISEKNKEFFKTTIKPKADIDYAWLDEVSRPKIEARARLMGVLGGHLIQNDHGYLTLIPELQGKNMIILP